MAEMDYYKHLLKFNDFYAPEGAMVRNNYKEILQVSESKLSSAGETSAKQSSTANFTAPAKRHS